MAMDAAMALTNRLLANAQALAGITAHLQSTADGKDLDPDLRSGIERVIDALGARAAIEELTDSERTVVVAFARSYLRQALEIVDDPFRPNSWSHADATILQAQGAASGVVARLIAEAGLGDKAGRILDIGTGVGGLAIAFCETFPGATVAGLDPWEPSLTLARANVARAGLGDRIALHQTTIQDYEDSTGFDLIWLPSFFIPRAVMTGAIAKARSLLRSNGRLVVGVVESGDDQLGEAVDAMITIRSGGSVLSPDEAVAMLSATGFGDASEVRRTWQAPLRLVAGRGTA